MDFKKTIDLMQSADYKERFVAEYFQTKIRYERLKLFNTKIEASEVCESVADVAHDCPLFLLKEQQKKMGEYLHILELRAIIENVDLTSYE